MEEIKDTQKNEQELNNILLDKDENSSSSSNSKKILVGGALLFVFLIIVVAVMRALNSSDSKDDKTFLPPEPKEKKEVDNSPLFKKIEVEDNKEIDKKFEKIINEIKSKTNTQPEPIKPKAKEVVVTPPKPREVQKSVTTPKEEVINKPEKNIIYKPAIASATSTEDVPKGFYIQVGAFYSLKPSPILLNNIKAKGFSYEMYKTRVNSKDVTKVIIGPYNNKDEAKNSLLSVKDKINASAYILKIK
jgi:DedD protein